MEVPSALANFATDAALWGSNFHFLKRLIETKAVYWTLSYPCRSCLSFGYTETSVITNQCGLIIKHTLTLSLCSSIVLYLGRGTRFSPQLRNKVWGYSTKSILGISDYLITCTFMLFLSCTSILSGFPKFFALLWSSSSIQWVLHNRILKAFYSHNHGMYLQLHYLFYSKRNHFICCHIIQDGTLSFSFFICT